MSKMWFFMVLGLLLFGFTYGYSESKTVAGNNLSSIPVNNVCQKCNNTGMYMAVCGVCKGSGQVSVNGVTTTCSGCGGIGKGKIYCGCPIGMEMARKSLERFGAADCGDCVGPIGIEMAHKSLEGGR